MLAFLIWVLEALVHTFLVKPEQNFYSHFFTNEPHEIWMRILILIVFFGFSIVTQIFILKNNKEKRKVDSYNKLLAHDFRNIVSNINSAVELSSIYLHEQNFFKLEEMLSIIKNQSVRSNRIITNIVKLSKVENEKVFTNLVEVNKEIQTVIELINKSYPLKNINIQTNISDEKFQVEVNELLEQVFENLLNNAIKYDTNDKIEISIFISKETISNIKYIKMEFKDHGIGILDKIKSQIFEKSHLTDANKNGMGLGLFLVKRIMDKYKGKIWVEDSVSGDHSKGNNFIILLKQAQ